MAKEIEIPEGYEARIEGNKVIIEQKESEDEKIRKEIRDYFAVMIPGACQSLSDKYSRWIAYLEKQKEQKLEEYSPLCNTIKDKIREYIANHFIADTVVKTDMKSIVKAMEEGVRLGKKEQQPAEWSEEDEKIIDEICGNLEYILHNTICAEQTKVNLENRIKWLIRPKSLRPQPHWKPSEEQMNALDSAINYLTEHTCTPGNSLLISLYNDLKKL